MDGYPYQPLRLMMTDVKYRKYSWCYPSDPYGGHPNGDEILCSVSMDWPTISTGVCYGDSGGPLYKIRPDNKLYQIGVLSYGNSYNCGEFASLLVIHTQRHVHSHRFHISRNQRCAFEPSDTSGTCTGCNAGGAILG